MVRIGFIGLGAMAQNHLRRLQEIPGAQVVAGADLNPERCREAAGQWGLSTYAGYREMLEQESLQAVYVCVPPFAHDGQEEAVARRGLALLVEKPLSLDLAYAQRVARVIGECGVVNAVGYQFRYLDVVEEARRVLAGAPIIAMRGFYFAPLPPSAWWRRRELSGGQIVEQATHVLDLMRYLAGEVVRVSAESHQGALADVPDCDVDDAVSVNLRFASGAIANLMCTCALSNQYAPGLEIIARGHRLWLDLPPQPARVERKDGVDMVVASAHDRFIREDQAFVEAVSTGQQSLIRSDYADASKTLALTLTVQAAADGNSTLPVGQEEGVTAWAK